MPTLPKSALLQGPRLPALPSYMVSSAPVAPPPPPPPVPQVFGQTDNLEIGTYTIQGVPALPVDTPISVYTTKRRWRGVDVYVDPQFVLKVGKDPFVRVWVYALTGTRRVLVKTGWVRGNNDTNGIVSAARRAASFRGLAERFEVVVELVGFSQQPGTTVEINVVASDECTETDPDADAVSLLGEVAVGTATEVPRTPIVVPANRKTFQTELLGAIVTNTTGAVLYWLTVDAPTVAAAVGFNPVVSIAVPPQSTVLVPAELLQGYRYGQQGCVCSGSSSATALALIPAGNILQQVWGR